MHNQPRILALGDFHPNDISIDIVDTPLHIDTPTQKQIDDIWQEKEQEAKEKNLNFYNGTSYRLVDWKLHDGQKLSLEFATIQFKERYGINVLRKINKLESSLEHLGCYVGANVKTKDGKYILVRLTGVSVNNNELEWPGGITETDIPCRSGQYLFDVLYQELAEEVGVEEVDIADTTLRLIYTSDNGHVGFHFDVTLNITMQDLEKRFPENEDEDIKALNFYNWYAYTRALKKHRSAQKTLIAEYMIRQDSLENHNEMNKIEKLQINNQFATTVEMLGNEYAEECIIFSHGFGVGRDSRGMFSDIVEILGESYQCVLFDYADIDQDGGTQVYSYSLMQETLRRVIEHINQNLKPKKLHLIAHSMGCMLGMEQGVEFDTRVLLAPSAEPLGVRLAEYFQQRPGTVCHDDGSMTAMRSNGTTTTVNSLFFTELEFRNPITIYRAVEGESRVLVALEDEILGKTEDKLQQVKDFSLDIVSSDHNFKDESRAQLMEYVQDIFM